MNFLETYLLNGNKVDFFPEIWIIIEGCIEGKTFGGEGLGTCILIVIKTGGVCYISSPSCQGN